MAKYSVTYTCGHEATIQLFGKHKDREWRLQYEERKLCPDCYLEKLRKEREEENRKAAEAAKEQELPQLVGSEKQIAWAETIRQKFLDKLSDLLTHLKSEIAADPACSKTIDSFYGETSSRWWIDNRFELDGVRRLFATRYDKYSKEVQNTEAIPAINDAKIEATVRPESPVTETVAEIRPLESSVEVNFPEKHEDFRGIMKSLGFKWEDGWKRNIGVTTGAVKDRAAEAGNKLLLAGFIIRIYDAEIRQAAISGAFESECSRWITRRKDGDKFAGWFSIRWYEDNQKLYNASRKLPRSKWYEKSVVVPPEFFAEVLDFASMYGFKLSEKAQEVAESARAAKDATLTASAGKKKTEKPVNPIIPTLKPEEFEADENLRDND